MTTRATTETTDRHERYERLPLDLIVPGHNPRKRFDEAYLAELTESIAAKDVIEPIIVRPKGEKFMIVVGECRWRATQRTTRTTIPAIIRDYTDTEALETAIIENLQRRDVNPMEEAESYQALQKADKKLYTVAAIAARVGKDESFVYRRLKLLELSKDLQAALAEDRLSIAHAEKLMRLPLDRQKEAVDLRGRGVVWRRNPLLEHNEKWVPTREDLLPLNELEQFIRSKSHFDPNAEAARHLQPQLAEALEELREDSPDEANLVVADAAAAALIELSDDPMVRMRVGAKASDPAPLSPSKWKELKTAAALCPHAERGVVTQTTRSKGYGRIVKFCRKKSCHKHWPVKPAAKKASATSARPRQTEDTWQERQRKEKEREEAAAAAWAPIKAKAIPALVAHFATAKLTADFIWAVLDDGSEIGDYALEQTEKLFDVKLTDKNIAQVFGLSCFSDYTIENREDFMRVAKRWKFNLAGIESQVKAEQKAAGKSSANGTKPASKKGGAK